jgi:hypothetical protein
MLDTDSIVAVTFDVGQTLTSLDTTMLAARVRAMGVQIDEGSIAGALDRAWQDYNAAVKSAPASRYLEDVHVIAVGQCRCADGRAR